MIKYPSFLDLPEYYIKSKVSEFILEDAPFGDITTMGTIDKVQISTAEIQAEESMVFAGEKIIRHFLNENAEVEVFFKDGSYIENNEAIARISAVSSHILIRERILLNLLQRLCGIATLTRNYVDIAKPYGVKILDTRKTTPGLRLFEKYAVAVGGGSNHRLDLSSGILIKDNHIFASGGIKQAVEKMRISEINYGIEVEISNFTELKEALKAGVDGILLDNLSPDDTEKAVKIIRNYPKGDKIFIETSGGINLNNVEDYIASGIDGISIGGLTHSVKCSSIHLEFIK
ncbi:MAG: carboxylating nicotinate-nucleotide diphosphorylase [Candidatus Kapabacteria bacterium]|nr:carboxylating nicotinate-nucleotide diphosphorylase [Candidatus Kapabacteria bacterium]